MRRLLLQAIVLLVVAAVPAAVAGLWHPRKPMWSGTVPAEGEVMIDTTRAWEPGVLWIDARGRAAYDAGHLPGALWLNEDAWDENLPAVLDAWSPGVKVVVYCDSATCDASHAVADRLRAEAEIDEVYVLHDGWDALTGVTP